MRHYGSESTPEYNLLNVRTKVHIMYAGLDSLNAPEVNDIYF